MSDLDGAGLKIGVLGIEPVVLTPDGRAWAYGYQRQLSEIFVVDSRETKR